MSRPRGAWFQFPSQILKVWYIYLTWMVNFCSKCTEISLYIDLEPKWPIFEDFEGTQPPHNKAEIPIKTGSLGSRELLDTKFCMWFQVYVCIYIYSLNIWFQLCMLHVFFQLFFHLPKKLPTIPTIRKSQKCRTHGGRTARTGGLGWVGWYFLGSLPSLKLT